MAEVEAIDEAGELPPCSFCGGEMAWFIDEAREQFARCITCGANRCGLLMPGKPTLVGP